MSKHAKPLSLCNDERSQIQEIRDNNPIYSTQYKKAVVLLECEKGTLNKDIARILYMSPSNVTLIKKNFLDNRMKIFDENEKQDNILFKKSFCDDELKEYINELKNNNEIISMKVLQDYFCCSESTIKRALIRLNISIKDESVQNNILIKDTYRLAGLYLNDNDKIAIFEIGNNKITSNIDELCLKFAKYMLNKDNNCSNQIILNQSSKEFIGNCINNDSNFLILSTNEQKITNSSKYIQCEDSNDWISRVNLFVDALDESTDNKHDIKQAIKLLLSENNEKNLQFSWNNNQTNKIINIANEESNNDTLVYTVGIYGKNGFRYSVTGSCNTSQNLSSELNQCKNKEDFVKITSNLESDCKKGLNNACNELFKGAINSAYNDVEEKKRNVTYEALFGRNALKVPCSIVSGLYPHEYMLSSNFTTTVLDFVLDNPYESSIDKLNILLNREEDQIIGRTINSLVMRKGAVRNNILNFSRNTLLSKCNITSTNVFDLKKISKDDLLILIEYSIDMECGVFDKDKISYIRLGNFSKPKLINFIKDNVTKAESEAKNRWNDCLKEHYTSLLSSSNLLLFFLENNNLKIISNDKVYKRYGGSKIALYNEGFLKKAIRKIEVHNSKDPTRIVSLDEVCNLEYDPNLTVYIEIDDVYVPHQAEKRCVNGKDRVKLQMNVSHTNVHIKIQDKEYYITADDTDQACVILLAFLIHNDLINNQLVFFMDGAKQIRNALDLVFAKFNIEAKFYLDWYHLCKRLYENLSMGLKGGMKDEKNKSFVGKIIKQLWWGKTDVAIKLLTDLNTNQDIIVNRKVKIDEIIKYLIERKPYICCYGLRRCLHLVNSSNKVESANFLVTTKRQKHHGMSWGFIGSKAMSTLRALRLNKELKGYLSDGRIRFTPINLKKESKNTKFQYLAEAA